MARRGLPLWAIQYLGRWGSDSVRLYTAQAYADRHAALSLEVAASRPVRRGAIDSEHWEVVAEAQAPDFSGDRVEGAQAVEDVIGGGVPAVTREPAEGMRQTQGEAGGGSPRYVINRGTGLAHRLEEGWAPTQPLMGWRAACGWNFSGANALLVAARPPRPWCGQPGCFKGVPPPGDDDDGSSG